MWFFVCIFRSSATITTTIIVIINTLISSGTCNAVIPCDGFYLRQNAGTNVSITQDSEKHKHEGNFYLVPAASDGVKKIQERTLLHMHAIRAKLFFSCNISNYDNFMQPSSIHSDFSRRCFVCR